MSAHLIRAIRAKLNLTQAQLADRLGVSFASVNRWEGGISQPQKAARDAIQALAGQAGLDDNAGPEPEQAAAEITRRRRSRATAKEDCGLDPADGADALGRGLLHPR